MIISARRSEQLRVAIANDGVLEDFRAAIADSGMLRGNVYRGIVRRVEKSLNAAFVDIGVGKDAFLAINDVCEQAWHRPYKGNGRPTIDQVIEKGRTVLVQVTRDGTGNKGAVIDTKVSLPGRFVVLTPLSEGRHISRKVENDAERAKLEELKTTITIPDGVGCILRTAAEGISKTQINRDINALLRVWRRIRAEHDKGSGPKLLYLDQDLIIQSIRDQLDKTFTEVVCDTQEALDRVDAAIAAFMPRTKINRRLYSERRPVFSAFGMESQIDGLFLPRVELPSGGSIVIESTEALTAIDVNSGRTKSDKGGHGKTALTTNLEAARSVALQLRLRDIGGLVVVDFIDMRAVKDQKQVERTLRAAMKPDRARVSISRISANGLLEINRQRLATPLVARTHRACPTCSGTGRIASPDTVALSLLHRITERAASGTVGGVIVKLHPELADAFQNTCRRDLVDLEEDTGISIQVIAATFLHRSEEEIEWLAPSKTKSPGSGSPAVKVTEISDGFQSEPEESSEAEGGVRKRRRRRRRGRKRPDDRVEENEHQAHPELDSHIRIPGEDLPPSSHEDEVDEDDEPKKPKRRRRRGGRKKKSENQDAPEVVESDEPAPDEEPKKKKRRRGGRKKKKDTENADDSDEAESRDDGEATPSATDESRENDSEATDGDSPPKRRRRRRGGRGRGRGKKAAEPSSQDTPDD